MSPRLPACLVLLLLLVAPSFADEPCTCNEKRTLGVWCDVHDRGYVAGVEIRSAELFEALDAHGHEIDDEYLDCETCKRFKKDGGFCEDHGRGWVGGLAYMSKLTYHLASGTLRDGDAIECPVCRKNADTHGWCAKCGVGMFGPVEVSGRQTFQELDHAYHTLLEAQKTTERCELCAGAMVIDGRCPVCKISYKDGKPTK